MIISSPVPLFVRYRRLTRSISFFFIYFRYSEMLRDARQFCSGIFILLTIADWLFSLRYFCIDPNSIKNKRFKIPHATERTFIVDLLTILFRPRGYYVIFVFRANKNCFLNSRVFFRLLLLQFREFISKIKYSSNLEREIFQYQLRLQKKILNIELGLYVCAKFILLRMERRR